MMGLMATDCWLVTKPEMATIEHMRHKIYSVWEWSMFVLVFNGSRQTEVIMPMCVPAFALGIAQSLILVQFQHITSFFFCYQAPNWPGFFFFFPLAGSVIFRSRKHTRITKPHEIRSLRTPTDVIQLAEPIPMKSFFLLNGLLESVHLNCWYISLSRGRTWVAHLSQVSLWHRWKRTPRRTTRRPSGSSCAAKETEKYLSRYSLFLISWSVHYYHSNDCFMLLSDCRNIRYLTI